LERRLTTLTAEWKETYPDIAETRRELQSVKQQLAEKYGDPAKEKDQDAAKTFDPYMRELVKQRNELRAEVSALKERRGRLVERIREFEHRVEQTPSREQEVMILVRDYDNMQKNYQALLDKLLNAHVAENLEKRQKGEQFRVLDPANLPNKPEKPNRLLIMMLGLLGGCGLGVGLAIGLDQMNPTFKRREQLEPLRGIRVLGTIPNFFSMYRQLNVNGSIKGSRVNGNEASHFPWSEADWTAPSWTTSPDQEDSLMPHFNLVAKCQSRSIAAEQYRMAATKLVWSTEGRSSTTIAVTSALKGEGKTTTVVNLGYTLARDLGKRTLLIDCDFRCPALHHYVKVPPPAGLIELLDGEASLEECLSVIDEVPCSIISVGGVGEEHNELTRIQQLSALLPKIRMMFDFVIINSSPVLPSATMGILAKIAEVLIMVIRAGVTPKHAVQQAFTMLGLTTEALVLLNAVEAQNMPYHTYEYSGPYGEERPIRSAAR
jgi:capsular exopolysaccharide synthesis family protein